MGDTVLNRVCRVIAECLNMQLAEVTPETGRDTCSEWDSLNFVSITVALAEEFGIAGGFYPHEYRDMVDVKGIVAALAQHRGIKDA